MELLIWLIRYFFSSWIRSLMQPPMYLRDCCDYDSFLRCNVKMLWKLLIYTEGLDCRYFLWQLFVLLFNSFMYPVSYVLTCFTCVQAERLSEFYEICRNLDIGRGEKFIKVEQVGLDLIPYLFLLQLFLWNIIINEPIDDIEAPVIVYASYGRLCERCSPGSNSSQGSGIYEHL